jgi:hypothetical protein
VKAEADTARTAGPNFFIVGAAKAGTTALHEWLAQHPDVFMSEVKEPCYFASDLGLPQFWSSDLSRYLSLFTEGAGASVRGESTPSYLLSREAARRIHAFCPEARIVIVIRNPIDAIRSVFAEARKFGLEPERAFADALAASDAGRPELERKPGGAWLHYRDVVRYAEQVERYIREFPADQLYIALYDDLQTHPALISSEILNFLNVDAGIAPRLERVNERRAFRSSTVQRLYMRPYSRGLPSDAPRRLMPLWRILRRANLAPVSDPPLEPGLHNDLVGDLGPDIARLGELLNRDLTQWLDPKRPVSD